MISRRRKSINGVEIILLKKEVNSKSLSLTDDNLKEIEGSLLAYIDNSISLRMGDLTPNTLLGVQESTPTTDSQVQQVSTQVQESIYQSLLESIQNEPIDGYVISYDGENDQLVWKQDLGFDLDQVDIIGLKQLLELNELENTVLEISNTINNYTTQFDTELIKAGTLQLPFHEQENRNGIMWTNLAIDPSEQVSITFGNDGRYVGSTGYSYGEVNSFSMKFSVLNYAGAGWVWANNFDNPVMSLSVLGDLSLKNGIWFETYTGSGDTLFTFSGIPDSQDGYVLAYDSGTSAMTLVSGAAGGGSGVEYLSALTDVNVPAPQDGQVLTWSTGNSWWYASAGGGSGGVTDHGDLTGLDDPNDHPQYLLTSATIYYSGLGDTSHTHTLANITDSAHTHDFSTQITNTGHTHALSDIGLVDPVEHSEYDVLSASVTAHTAQTNIHFTQGQIDHGSIQNRGTQTHVQIDNHITGSPEIHFEIGDINISAITSAHTHDFSTDITNTGHSHDFAIDITNTGHSHDFATDITNTGHTHEWDDLSTTAHTHPASQVTSGNFDVGDFGFQGDLYVTGNTTVSGTGTGYGLQVLTGGLDVVNQIEAGTWIRADGGLYGDKLYLNHAGGASTFVQFSGGVNNKQFPRIDWNDTDNDIIINRNTVISGVPGEGYSLKVINSGASITGEVESTSWIRANGNLLTNQSLFLDYNGDGSSTYIRWDGSSTDDTNPHLRYSSSTNDFSFNRDLFVSGSITANTLTATTIQGTYYEGIDAEEVGAGNFSSGTYTFSGQASSMVGIAGHPEYDLDVHGTARTISAIYRETGVTGTDQFEVKFNSQTKSLDFTFIG